MQRLRVIVPVFNDWASFSILLRQLDLIASTLPVRIAVTSVDDGSNESYEVEAGLQDLSDLTSIESVEIVHLAVNVGHQRAIAIGLCVAVDDADSDAVLVMDADGEDSPAVVPVFLQTAAGSKDFCIVARRRKRSESLTFKLSYIVYKFVFKLLTARQIDFGNFSLFSMSYAKRLVRVSDLWNNLPAAVLRSKLPIQSIPVDRARRYSGSSKMNFTSLVIHGFSGIAVYAETIFVRLLMLIMLLVGLSGILIVTVLTLRLFYPRLATPGWATTVTFGMIIILIQVLSVALSSILMLLNSRVQRLVVPFNDYRTYVDCRRVLLAARLVHTVDAAEQDDRKRELA